MTEKYARQFVRLSWQILEYKFAYYHPKKLHPSWNHLVIPDSSYDKKERLYYRLAKKLGRKPTAALAVGFPRDTPSGELVENKLSSKRRIEHIYVRYCCPTVKIIRKTYQA